MNVKVEDKIRLIKPMGSFANLGEVCKIVDISNDIISFRFGEHGMHLGCMSEDELNKYFEPAKSDTPSVVQEMVDEIFDESTKIYKTTFDKCTIMSVKLANGFVITESSACISPENYDDDLGREICVRKIKDKIWELEAYRLSCEEYSKRELDDDTFGYFEF